MFIKVKTDTCLKTKDEERARNERTSRSDPKAKERARGVSDLGCYQSNSCRRNAPWTRPRSRVGPEGTCVEGDPAASGVLCTGFRPQPLPRATQGKAQLPPNKLGLVQPLPTAASFPRPTPMPSPTHGCHQGCIYVANSQTSTGIFQTHPRRVGGRVCSLTADLGTDLDPRDTPPRSGFCF